MIYLIHFAKPIGSDRHQAQHYLGSVDDGKAGVEARLEKHRSGYGAKILAACNEKAIAYKVVATFPGGRIREREMKNRKNHRVFCPICSPSKPAKL